MADLFLSHSKVDAAWVRDLRRQLEAAGYTCWMAPDDVVGPVPWAEQILNAIDQCRVMVVVVSSASNVSQHVSKEVGIALEKSKPLLPIRVEDILPTGSLNYLLQLVQWVDAFPGAITEHLDRIRRALAYSIPAAPGAPGAATPAAPAPPPTTPAPPPAAPPPPWTASTPAASPPSPIATSPPPPPPTIAVAPAPRTTPAARRGIPPMAIVGGLAAAAVLGVLLIGAPAFLGRGGPPATPFPSASQTSGTGGAPAFSGNVSARDGVIDFVAFATKHIGQTVHLDLQCYEDTGGGCFMEPFDREAGFPTFLWVFDAGQCFSRERTDAELEACQGGHGFAIGSTDGTATQVRNGPGGAGTYVIQGRFAVRSSDFSFMFPPNLELFDLIPERLGGIAGTSAPTPAESLDPPVAALFAHIPERIRIGVEEVPLRETCLYLPGAAGEATDLVALCQPHELVLITYQQYPDLAALDAAYDAVRAPISVPAGHDVCRQRAEWPAEQTGDDGVSLCYTEGGEQEIYFTSRRTRMLIEVFAYSWDVDLWPVREAAEPI